MHARLRLKLIKSQKPQAKWSMLPPPVCALETRDIVRAQSILTGITFRDSERVGPLLPADKARDVIAWAGVR